MQYATGRSDAKSGREMVAVHGEEYARGYYDGRLEGIAANIRSAKTLGGLHDSLCEFEVVLEQSGDEAVDTESALKEHGIDICELPTFGGEWPKSTDGVWSWDEDSLLGGVGPFSDWRIVDREDQ